MTSCALVTEVRTCALPIYPAMMRGRHLVEQVPTFLGESHNRRSAVVGIDGRHDKFLSLKLTDDRGDIALRDKQRSRQIPHRLPVGITIERGHHVEAWQRCIELFDKIAAQPFFHLHDAAQKTDPDPEIERTRCRPLMFFLHSTLANIRSEEHTSELQSLMRTSYAVFCL